MKDRKTSILAWTLCGVATTSLLIQVAATLANLGPNDNASSLSEDLVWAFTLVVFAVVGALIVSRQPRNVIGWLLMCPILTFAIPVDQYISGFTTAPTRPSPLHLLALWFGNWSWLLLIFPTLFILLLFPTGHPPSRRWRWLIIAGLGMGAFFILFAGLSAEFVSGELETAWAVPNPIGFIQDDAFPMLLWTVLLGALTVGCAASVVVRFRRAATVERAQMKWLLYACTTFAAVYVLLVVRGGAEGNSPLDTVMLLLFPISLMTIPIAIAFAILRYHLWDIDVIIRRTLVYVPLTAILAGIFAASAKVSQTVLGALTGGQSEAGTVLTTLIVVAAFDPIKGRIQKIVDARFKEVSNPVERWKGYGEQVRTFVQMNDEIASVRRLLEEAVAVFDARAGAVYLQHSGKVRLVHSIGELGDVADTTIPLEHDGRRIGQLELGARRTGRPYDARDRELLAQNANAVAAAVWLVRERSNHG